MWNIIFFTNIEHHGHLSSLLKHTLPKSIPFKCILNETLTLKILEVTSEIFYERVLSALEISQKFHSQKSRLNVFTALKYVVVKNY